MSYLKMTKAELISECVRLKMDESAALDVVTMIEAQKEQLKTERDRIGTYAQEQTELAATHLQNFELASKEVARLRLVIANMAKEIYIETND
jgi:hypothetical protein